MTDFWFVTLEKEGSTSSIVQSLAWPINMVSHAQGVVTACLLVSELLLRELVAMLGAALGFLLYIVKPCRKL